MDVRIYSTYVAICVTFDVVCFGDTCTSFPLVRQSDIGEEFKTLEHVTVTVSHVSLACVCHVMSHVYVYVYVQYVCRLHHGTHCHAGNVVFVFMCIQHGNSECCVIVFAAVNFMHHLNFYLTVFNSFFVITFAHVPFA